ncbi:hypothetical protein KDH_32320 [Dictyobacter sp. S3.2.2.5]|uniref:Uncharacterized protein n=1 Tax=Dictyobacter halimunensis TaxID=3026934 RepID=A0ABQ6FV22_9CHLR|nr:hypothetical protein KDH_32320 [Dictyobacter sp. S3.2.2.5]
MRDLLKIAILIIKEGSIMGEEVIVVEPGIKMTAESRKQNVASAADVSRTRYVLFIASALR